MKDEYARTIIEGLSGLVFLGLFCWLILKTLNEPFVSILLFAYFVINTFIFRFQRTTLMISRKIKIIGVGGPNLQLILTPNWVGLLGWISQGLWIIISILLFFQFGWVFTLIFFLYVFIGVGFFDFITPFPSHNRCFKIIENNLNKEIQKASYLIRKGEPEKLLSESIKIAVFNTLLSEIIKIKDEYKIETK